MSAEPMGLEDIVVAAKRCTPDWWVRNSAARQASASISLYQALRRLRFGWARRARCYYGVALVTVTVAVTFPWLVTWLELLMICPKTAI